MIDLFYLKQRFNEHQVKRIVDTFVSSTRSEISNMKAAIEARDKAQLTLCAHRLCGSSLTVAAYQIASLCQRIEEASNKADWTTTQSSIAELEAFFLKNEP